MGYLDKYKGDYENTQRRSVYDILSLDPQKDWAVLDANYVAKDIDKVKIGGNTFTNYGDFQFVWEKSYNESPERSIGGVIDNLNSQTTFVTPHLILNFAVMSIDDYRKIMRLDLEQNEFVVECYDPIYNKKFEGKMYFATPQMAKLFKLAKIRFDGERWEEFVELVGVQEYTVELIGTNADLDLVSVIYHLNPPSDTGYADYSIGDNEIYSGEDVVIGAVATDITEETFNGKYKFSKWNVEKENPTIPKDTGNYLNGYSYTINYGDEIIADGQSAFHLYAQWDATTNHTLTFNYGLADPVINESSYSYETSRPVQQGQGIGDLPLPQTPTVTAKDIYGKEQEYDTVYSNPVWWKTPQKVKKIDENGNDITHTLIVGNNDPYWSSRDSSIYLLYDVAKYNLYLYVDGKLFQSNTVETKSGIEYNTPMNLPHLVREGERFDGWYTTEGTKVSGNMPPYDLTLYARWVEK